MRYQYRTYAQVHLISGFSWPGGHSGQFQAGTITVTSLSTILTEIAHRVGGDHVKVVPLVKAGMDPHEYDPKPEDLKMASDSQLILACGKNLENYLTKLSEITAAAPPS